MKRLAVFLFIFVFPLFFPLSIFAQNNLNSGESVSLGVNEVVNRDYFAAGQNITIDGTVNGDVYAAGGQINLNGLVNGDVLSAGGNINVNGTVIGNVRAVGGNININGKIGRNVSIAGGNIILNPKAEVIGSFTAAGGNFNLLGPVGKSVNIAGGQLNIENLVGGDVNAGIGQLSVAAGGRVNGDITYWSENKANINSQAKIVGMISQKTPPRQLQRDYAQAGRIAKNTAVGTLFALKLVSFLSALLIGFFLIKLFPVFTNRLAETMSQKWLLSLGLGFLILAITPVLLIFLLITLLGIPVAIAWLFFIVFSLWLVKIFIGLAIGLFIAKQLNLKRNRYLIFFVGLLIYYLIVAIPIIGWIFALITSLVGLGALVLTKRNYYIEFNQKKLI